MAMTQKPMRADRQRNHEALLAAAAKVFAREGFAVPLERIAAEAGVGRATLYRNYPNRSALALAVLDQNVARFEQLAEATAETSGGFRVMLTALAEDIADHAALGQAFSLREGAALLAPLRDRIVAVLWRFAEAGVATGELRADLSCDDVGLLLQTLGVGLSQGDHDLRRQQATRAVDLFFGGLSRRPE